MICKKISIVLDFGLDTFGYGMCMQYISFLLCKCIPPDHFSELERASRARQDDVRPDTYLPPRAPVRGRSGPVRSVGPKFTYIYCVSVDTLFVTYYRKEAPNLPIIIIIFTLQPGKLGHS